MNHHKIPAQSGLAFGLQLGRGRRAEDEGMRQVSGRAGLQLRSVHSEIHVCERLGGQV